MLYAGTYGQNLIQIVTSDVKFRITLFSPVNAAGYMITSFNLNTTKIKDYSEYVIASCITKQTLEIESYYGDLGELADLISALGNTKFFKAILEGYRFTDREVVNGVLIDIDIANSYIENTKKISGLTYISSAKKSTRDALQDNSPEFRAAQLSLLKNKVLTFQELVDAQVYDLSWLLNEDGSWKKDYRLINNLDDVKEIAKELSSPDIKIVSIDTEFTNLNVFWKHPNRARILGMSLSWKDDQGVYIPFFSNKFKYLDINDVMSILFPILEEKELVAHNGMAEVKILYSYGYLINITYDTLMLEFNLDPTVSRGSKALKTITRRIFGHETLELEDILGGDVHGELIAELDADLICVYACSDTDYTRQVLKHQLPQLPERSYPSYRLDNRIIQMLAMAEFYGAKLDTELLSMMSEINKHDLKRVEALCYKFIYEYGMRYQASLVIQERGLEATDELIEQIVNDEDFKAEMQGAFNKILKDGTVKKLQLSSTKDLHRIVFQILGYPVVRENDDGVPSITDAALQDWISKPAVEPIKFLRGDIVSVGLELKEQYKELSWIDKKSALLVEKKVFESTAYPFAYLLKQWRSLFKLQTSFFNRLADEQCDGWYYSETSLTSAETSRVVNNIQTLKGSLRRLITPFSDDYYMTVFDYDQIEFRVMIGIANESWKRLIANLRNTGEKKNLDLADKLEEFSLDDLVKNLSVPDRDYHREGGSKLLKTTPDKMTPAQRKKIKPVHFSVPYGAEAYSIAGDKIRLAKTTSEKQAVLEETEALLASWRKAMMPLNQYLNSARDSAMTRVPDEELPEHLKGMNLGRVYNQLGRFRWFNLDFRNPKPDEVAKLCQKTGATVQQAFFTLKDKIARTATGSIRRAGGNYPIQSLAREIFFDGMNKLYERLRREGYIGSNPDVIKFLMSLFIHDECNIQVHKSIHPFLVYKMIYEECLQRINGHPLYFMGIAFVNNWLDGKEDAYGASIRFVEACVKKYDEDPEYYTEEAFHITDHMQYIFVRMSEHFCKRVIEDTYKLLIDKTVDWSEFLDSFKDYYIKQRLEIYSKWLRSRAVPGSEDSRSKDEINKDKLGAYIEYCYERYASPGLLKRIHVFDMDREDALDWIGGDGNKGSRPVVSLFELRERHTEKLAELVRQNDTFVAVPRVQLSGSGDTTKESLSGFKTRIECESIHGVKSLMTRLDDRIEWQKDVATGVDGDSVAGKSSVPVTSDATPVLNELNGPQIVELSDLNALASAGVLDGNSGIDELMGSDAAEGTSLFDELAQDISSKVDRLSEYIDHFSETSPSLFNSDELASGEELLGELSESLLPEVGESDMEDDKLDLDMYEVESDSIEDVHELCNAVIHAYVETAEEIELESAPTVASRDRVIIGFQNSVTIDCCSVNPQAVIEVIHALEKFKAPGGYSVVLELSQGHYRKLGYSIGHDFNKDRINDILNGGV